MYGSNSHSKVMLVRLKHRHHFNPISQEIVLGWSAIGATFTAHVSCLATKVSMEEDISICNLFRNVLVPKGNFCNISTTFCRRIRHKTTTKISNRRLILRIFQLDLLKLFTFNMTTSPNQLKLLHQYTTTIQRILHLRNEALYYCKLNSNFKPDVQILHLTNNFQYMEEIISRVRWKEEFFKDVHKRHK